MRKLIQMGMKFLRLSYLWVARILFAKNHFKVSFLKKLALNIFGGYTSDQYALYDFKHRDRREYLSEFDWYRSRYINEPFNTMMDNKVICTEVLKHYVNVPRIFAANTQDKVIQYEKDIKTYQDIITLLKREKRLYIKPISAGKGKGVYLFRYDDAQIFIDNTAYSEEKFISFLKSTDDWLITEAIAQHPFLDKLYDKTTNTIRVITMKEVESGEMKIFFAVQRIGTAKTIPVDNGSRGGLVSNIDLKTGRLSAARSLHSLSEHAVHPDSGNPIEGIEIPEWESVKAEVLTLARRFPFMNLIAWDILLVPEGICVIEANTSSGVNIIQLWGGQKNGELGDFYRYYKII